MMLACWRHGVATLALLCTCTVLLHAQPTTRQTESDSRESIAPDSTPVPGMITLPAGDRPAEPVYMRFVNSRTGLGVAPGKISIDGQPVKFQVERQSLVVLSVPVGRHTIEATAAGFEPMRIDVTAGTGAMPVMEVELDPSSSQADNEIDPEHALLLGTVADADTAEPLSKAKIDILGSGLSETTTASGEFRFDLTTGKASAQSRPAVSLEIHAEGYVPLRLTDLSLDAGGQARVPIKLSRKTSGSAELMEKNASNTPGQKYATDWTFDVTFR